jgi:hypothetical protein
VQENPLDRCPRYRDARRAILACESEMAAIGRATARERMRWNAAHVRLIDAESELERVLSEIGPPD